MTMLEVISGNVPYYQYAFDVAIFHALSKKQPPKRPQELSGSDERSTHMWTIFLQCWDHDPSARPNASSVLASGYSIASDHEPHEVSFSTQEKDKSVLEDFDVELQIKGASKLLLCKESIQNVVALGDGGTGDARGVKGLQ
ncbi:hypothetical protein BDV93DRAFT_590957 [Ceratobasidium sp. AG-I]|nr:hypothetical protein BDV93DRAFT_590957 [Ceratobasidium sp. AG-I]